MDEKKDNEYITLANGKKINKKTWIMSTLRRASYRWPSINEAERRARVDRGLYQCAMCQGSFRNGEYAKDHIVPIVPYEGFPLHPITGGPDWTIIIERLFCNVEDIQVLCHSCHDSKSSIEDTMRANHTADTREKEKLLKKAQKKLAKSKKIE